MASIIKAKTLFNYDGIIQNGMVIISDEGKITYSGPATSSHQNGAEILDFGDLILAPGLIDIHLHGGLGLAFENMQDISDLSKYSQWVASTGVCGYLRSIAAPSPQDLVDLIRAHVVEIKNEHGGARPLGLHLEGPFLNPQKKGAFSENWLRLPSIEEAQQCLDRSEGYIRQITIAPELAGAEDVARIFREAGVTVALGHSNTDVKIANAALQNQFNHVTHTFNAQSSFDHRNPGVMGAILASDNVTAELIADTIHVHPIAIKILLRCLGKERVTLVTDAICAAGLEDGTYNLVGQQVTVKDHSARLSNGTLAGSVITLNQCVSIMNKIIGVSLYDAVRMASLNPAKAIGLETQTGSIQPGKIADMIIIDENVNVYLTMVQGKIVFRKK